MPSENELQERERKQREALFQRRVAELTSNAQQFPWMMGQSPQFQIPKEESKLLADREVEEPGMTESELERRALMDLVGRNHNFTVFYKRLNYELRRARRYKRPLSLVLVGVDHLGEISLRHGIDATDQSIQLAARHILASIRDVDIPGRCREDTFGIILPETDGSGAAIAAERIRTTIEKLLVPFVREKKILVTVSVGVAHIPEHGEHVEHLFGSAVEALLRTMKSGGNAVTIADSLH